MPFIHIQLAPAAGIQADGEEVARSLTRLARDVLHKREQVTAVRVERVPPDAWFIGAQPVGRGPKSTVHVQIQITAGTNSTHEKAAFVAAAFEALSTLLGGLHEASYVVVQEIAADAWGYGGHTQAARKAGAVEAVPA